VSGRPWIAVVDDPPSIQYRIDTSPYGSQGRRLPATAHTSQPWRIHGLAGEFRLEDVWELPCRGTEHDFPRLVALLTAQDASNSSSCATRTLFALRWKIGEVLGWDAGPAARALKDRLPADLRDTPTPEFRSDTFTSLYLLEREFAAEASNRTMHGVLHVGWVPTGTGEFRGQMAVLVRPNGLFGEAYMAAIRPFRHRIVYPAMLRELERAWRRSPAPPQKVAA
jgi:hypothetical protein